MEKIATEHPIKGAGFAFYSAIVSIAVLLGCVMAGVMQPAPVQIIRYVDENGNPVTQAEADGYFAERTRLDAIEREGLRKLKEARVEIDSDNSNFDVSSSGRSFPNSDEGLRATGGSLNRVHVDGYYKKNGTYVAPHDRSRGNSTQRDNWSTKGNVNPVTRRQGTRKASR